MVEPAGRQAAPSLRRRFALWFGALFVLGAVALRALHYRAAVDGLARDIDVLLWSRLSAVKSQERFAPDTLLDPHFRDDGMFLPELPLGRDARLARLVGLVIPPLLPPADDVPFAWFAGVWHHDGGLVDHLDIPAEIVWDPRWRERIDTVWTTDDDRHRLAATAGANETLVVVGAPLAGFVAAARRELAFQVLTFVIWVPLVLGVGWLAITKLLAPLAGIAETARRIRAGRFAERIDLGRADAELEEMAGTINDMLDRLDTIRESQARFNADVAHQLLNPVHAILLESEAGTPARPAEELAASLGRVGGLAHRIEHICDVLLAYSRSAALDPERMKRVDLEPIVVAAIDRVGPRATAGSLTVVPPPSGAVVRGDPALLEEVFVNLLANAVEHSRAGGRIEVRLTADAGGCRVSVVDQGVGVAAETLPRLFQRLHSGKPTGGHGIGLALSRRIARSHGGDLTHEPTPGGGATFTISFPPCP
jgi:signal transduction histidine kinase